ncbi:MAG: cobalt-precorrin-5B (C(1))-methyltransferase [Thermodesulforhabdaceae bacterium]
MKNKNLRKGFSTGTAATAAIVAAVKALLGCPANGCVSIRLPIGFYIPVTFTLRRGFGNEWIAEVKKDGGDDPDITHGAIISASVSFVERASEGFSGIWLDAGKGVGVVTRPGLPVPPGEPAINPVPRQMISENVSAIFLEELNIENFEIIDVAGNLQRLPLQEPGRRIFLPIRTTLMLPFDVHVVLEIPEGEYLAKRTLNPRLGIVEGLSVLGTSGLVKPFSHEAYEETIDYALRFARTNDCSTIVLTTGGKSELYARRVFPEFPETAFIQIADFFSFSVKKAQEYGFSEVIHAVFFGKAAKMALGFSYTHAREGLADMAKLARIAGLTGETAEEATKANTLRQVLDMLKEKKLFDAIRSISREALHWSAEFAPDIPSRRIVLFDYDGTLLCEEFFPGNRCFM